GAAAPTRSAQHHAPLLRAHPVDGLKTSSHTGVPRAFDDIDCYPIQLPGAQNRPTLSFEQFRINSFPSMAIDPTNGTIAIAWADNEGAGSCGTGAASFSGVTSNQVKLVTSSNGTVWSAPIHVTSGAA